MKSLKIILIIAGILTGLWIVARTTHMLGWYSTATISNYPTIDAGNSFFASNLVRPKRFSFICYHMSTPESGKETSVYRLCGLEGDTIEIKDGSLWVNNKYADSSLSLAHNYVVASTDVEKVTAVEKIDASLAFNISPDSMVIYLSDKAAAVLSNCTRRLILPESYADSTIRQVYSQPWNQDHFGPVIVPRGKYFVLGDNRLNALDSRYQGFIDQSDYIATVLGK